MGWTWLTKSNMFQVYHWTETHIFIALYVQQSELAKSVHAIPSSEYLLLLMEKEKWKGMYFQDFGPFLFLGGSSPVLLTFDFKLQKFYKLRFFFNQKNAMCNFMSTNALNSLFHVGLIVFSTPRICYNFYVLWKVIVS